MAAPRSRTQRTRWSIPRCMAHSLLSRAPVAPLSARSIEAAATLTYREHRPHEGLVDGTSVLRPSTPAPCRRSWPPAQDDARTGRALHLLRTGLVAHGRAHASALGSTRALISAASVLTFKSARAYEVECCSSVDLHTDPRYEGDAVGTDDHRHRPGGEGPLWDCSRGRAKRPFPIPTISRPATLSAG